MKRLELEANFFRIFTSLWYLPLVNISKKIHGVGVTWPGWFNMELRNEAFFFLLVTIAMITVKMSFTHFHSSSFREIYFFIKIMKPISPNYNWENGVKQIKIIDENLSQSYILCQLLRKKTLASRPKCIKQFFLFLPLFALYLLSGCDLLNMSCLS